jgi:hypothetical protein
MRLLDPPPEVVPFGLRALKMIATVDRPLSVTSANVLAGAQRALLHTDIPLDGLPSIEPAELAAHVVDPELRRQLVQGMLVLALADGPPSDAQMTLVESFAAALGVDRPELLTLRLLADRHMTLFRLDFLRQSHLARVVTDAIRHDGLVAAAKGVLGMRGLAEDVALAARYRALEGLPDDTLGRHFVAYVHRNGFAYPGEKGGFPETGVYHDFGHVLTGYATDPEGEMQMVGFQTGYMKRKPAFMMLFGVITFSAGLNVTPLPQPLAGGVFAHEGMMERLIRAVRQGAKLTTDLSEAWDHWAHVERPIDEVRAILHLEPA